MSRLLTGFLALIAFGLAACDNTDTNRQESVAKADVSSASLPEVVESLPQSPSPGSAHEEDAAEMLWIDYACDSGKNIRASYINNEESSSAHLEIDGRHYALYGIVTASGAGYASEQGLRPDEGMKWLTKGDEAVLIAMILDDTVNPDEVQVLMRCQTITD